jgi:hypothetical protein
VAITGKTARRALKYLLTTDPPELHANYEQLANQLDNDVEGGQGKLSERTTAKLRGRLFVVAGDTALLNGSVYWDSGTEWVLLNPKGAPPSVSVSAVSMEAKSGELIEATAAITVTLPALATGIVVDLFATVNGVNLKAAGGTLIYGDFMNAAGQITLAANQHVRVVGTPTAWLITAGEPKREQAYTTKTYTKAEAEAGVEPSASRDAFVTIYHSEATANKIEVGVITVAEMTQSNTWSGFVPAGAKWKANREVRVTTLLR